MLNSLTAGLDVLLCLWLFACLLRFQRYCRELDILDRGENVRIGEYSIELFGLKGLKHVEPAQVKEHVENALKTHAEAMQSSRRERHRAQMWKDFVDQKCYEVVDVTMIANDRGVLNGLVKVRLHPSGAANHAGPRLGPMASIRA